MFGALMGAGFAQKAFATDYPASSPIALWRDDYDRRAREGEAKYYALNKYPWAVQSAKDAGLHPLFALGASGGGGTLGGANTAIRTPGGGGQIAPPRKPNARLLEAQIRTEEARADLLSEQAQASRAARGRQGQPYTTEDGAHIWPLGSKAGAPLTAGPTITPRSTAVQPTSNIQLWDRVEGPGGQVLRSLSKHLQADELNQIYLAAQQGWDMFLNTGRAIGLDRIPKFGQNMMKLYQALRKSKIEQRRRRYLQRKKQ